MGADKTGTTIRGLLIPDPRVTFKDTYKPALSTLTEAGPRVGVPRSTVDTDMVLQTSGEQGAGGDIRIESQYSGHPKNNGGSFLWYNGADTAALKHRGWEPPWTFAGLERVKSPIAGRNRAVNFDVLTTQNDTLVSVGIHPTTAGATSADPWEILCWHKAPAAATWTEVKIADDADLSEGAKIQSARIDGWNGPSSNSGPALLELPDGRLLCFFWVHIYSAFISGADRKFWQIRAHVSDDKGATWSLYQEHALTAPLEQFYATQEEHYPGRLRAAYKDGQVLLLATIRDEIPSATPSGFVGTKAGRTILGQWASSSLGATFDHVEFYSGTAAQSGGFFDVVTHTGKFIVAAVHDSADPRIEIRKIGSAYQKLSAATPIAVPDTDGAGDRSTTGSGPDFLNRGELTLAKAPDGNLYLCFVQLGFNSSTLRKQSAAIQVSYNGGDTWQDVGGKWDSAASVDWDAGDSAFYAANYDFGIAPNRHIRDRLRHIAATWHRGRLALVCSYDETDPGATPDDEQAGPLVQTGTYCMYMGGYSNLTLGSNVGTPRLERRANYREHWAPFQHPETAGNAWTRTASGVHTAILSEDAKDQPFLELTTGDGAGAAGDRYYDDSALARTATLDTASASSHTMRLHAEWALDCTSGGSVANNGVSIRFRVGRAGAGEIFNVRYKADGTVTIYDLNGAVQIYSGTLSSAGLSYPAAFRMVTYDRKVALYAQDYTANDTDREWVKLYESANAELSEAAAAGRDCEIRFGHLASGGAATINKSRWYYVQAGAHNDAFGPICAVPQVNDWIDYSSPEDCGPRYYSGSAIYIDDGAKVAAKDGPTVHGDSWKIQTRYDFGIENVHHEIAASPARTWRSTGTAAEALIRWDVDTAQAAYTPGPAIGLYLGNINFRTAVFQAYDHTGAWVDLATVDARQQVHFLRKGNTVSADTGASTHTSAHFHTYNSLAGSSFVFNPAASGANPDPFEILGNTEGSFSNIATAAATTKSPILRLSGDVSAMPANGVGEIWSKDLLLVVHVDSANTYQRFRLKIPTTMPGITTLNGTAAGYWEIGTLIIGHVAAFGRQYARGHIRQLAPNADLQTGRGGTRRATRLGPSRRSVEFAWADSIDVTEMQEDSPAPAYIKAKTGASSAAVATVADTAWLMEGLITALDGPVTPVVYIPRLTVAGAGTDSETITDPNRMLYGRIVSDRYRIENVIGDEWASEVVTASAVRIDEEV